MTGFVQEAIEKGCIAVDAEQAETPESMVARLRDKEGEPDGVIAVRLKEKFFPRINQHELMRAINPERVSGYERLPAPVGRPKQWFADLRKKGVKILNEREKK